jgi:hypothetical protein
MMANYIPSPHAWCATKAIFMKVLVVRKAPPARYRAAGDHRNSHR